LDICAGATEFLVTPLLMGPVCLLSQGPFEDPVRPWRFYNRREPQETTDMCRRPRRNRTDRNQNVNLPRPSANFRRDKNIRRTAENRGLDRISGKFSPWAFNLWVLRYLLRGPRAASSSTSMMLSAWHMPTMQTMCRWFSFAINIASFIISDWSRNTHTTIANVQGGPKIAFSPSLPNNQ